MLFDTPPGVRRVIVRVYSPWYDQRLSLTTKPSRADWLTSTSLDDTPVPFLFLQLFVSWRKSGPVVGVNRTRIWFTNTRLIGSHVGTPTYSALSSCGTGTGAAVAGGVVGGMFAQPAVKKTRATKAKNPSLRRRKRSKNMAHSFLLRTAKPPGCAYLFVLHRYYLVNALY